MDNKLRWLALGWVVLALGGCVTAEKKETETKIQYWPSLPEQPRFVHEATIRGGNDVNAESDEQRFRRLLTGGEKKGQRLMKPFALDVYKGRMYVTDTQIRMVHVFDLVRRKHFPIGYRFEGKLTRPRGVAVDANGMVYVVDDGLQTKRVVVYDGIGLYNRTFDLGAETDRPTGIAVSPDGSRIFVVDTGGIDSRRHRVLEFNAEGKLVRAIGTRGSGEGEFNLPVDVAYSPDGLLYVLDAGNFRVQVFKDGQFVRSWGKVGVNLGDLARPRSIELDKAGSVYVSDAQYTNVQIFTPEGELLLPLGKRGFEDKNGLLVLVGGIAIDDTDRLYVIDQMFGKVEIYRHIPEEEGQRLVQAFKGNR